jgi:hypothetical protein
VLKRILGRKSDGIMGDQDEKLHNIHSTPNKNEHVNDDEISRACSSTGG